jgi:hypothetical protein
MVDFDSLRMMNYAPTTVGAIYIQDLPSVEIARNTNDTRTQYLGNKATQLCLEICQCCNPEASEADVQTAVMLRVTGTNKLGLAGNKGKLGDIRELQFLLLVISNVFIIDLRCHCIGATCSSTLEACLTTQLRITI